MLRGVIVPLVTPLDASGAVCKQSVESLVGSLRGRVSGLMPTLSSGEGWKLSERQWRDAVAYTRACAGGLPVLAGVQLPETSQVIARTHLAKELGVDAVVVTTPFQKNITQGEIYEHYRALRDASPVPIFLYNEAALSGNNIEVETLAKICTLPDVVGIKESSGSAEFTQRLIAARTGVPIFQGWENLFLESPGVDGYVAPLANLDPELCSSMLAAPGAETQAKITAACERYGLFRDDWYRGLKQELVRRGVIATEKVVDHGG